MTRTFLYILGTATAVGLTLASACTVTSTDDDDTIVGAGGNTTATTSQSTTSAGGTGAQGGAGVGGSATCASCGEVWEGAAMFDDICGLTGDTCAPNSSCALIQAIGECICDAANQCLESCATACDPNDGTVTEECKTCAESDCAGAVGECTSDPGASG